MNSINLMWKAIQSLKYLNLHWRPEYDDTCYSTSKFWEIFMALLLRDMWWDNSQSVLSTRTSAKHPIKQCWPQCHLALVWWGRGFWACLWSFLISLQQLIWCRHDCNTFRVSENIRRNFSTRLPSGLVFLNLHCTTELLGETLKILILRQILRRIQLESFYMLPGNSNEQPR